MHTSTFGLKFGSLSPAVTLKIRSRSPKPKQLIITSQCYIPANLVKIHPPVHEISCKQESVTLTLTLTPTPTLTLTPTPTGSAPKQYVPLPFGGGHNQSSKNTQTYMICEQLIQIKTAVFPSERQKITHVCGFFTCLNIFVANMFNPF